MLIKKLIQRLLDSRTTPSEAVVANRANNTGTNIAPLNTVISSGGWTTILSAWAAPNDGYIKSFGNIVKLDASVTGGSFAIIGTALHGSFSGPAIGSSLRGFLPLRKGESVTIMAVNARDIVVTFYSKIVGGGHNHFIWRALSCLRPSFNYLPRSFCKAKNLGFQNNQLLLSIRALIFLAQAPRISLPTPHRATAGRLLGAIQLQSQLLKSKSRTGRWHLLPYLTETLRELESVVTLKKGHRLSSCAVAEVQPIILFGSTKQVQTFNPLTGGALC